MDGWIKTMCHIHAMGYNSALRSNLDISDNIDEPGGPYAKWNTLDTEV